MYRRTLNEIIDAAVIHALERLNSYEPKVKTKYKYKDGLKSRKGKK